MGSSTTFSLMLGFLKNIFQNTVFSYECGYGVQICVHVLVDSQGQHQESSFFALLSVSLKQGLSLKPRLVFIS